MLNKQEETLLKELLNKYKQGYISGLIPGSNITFSPSGCRNKIVFSTGGGGGGSPAGSDTQIQYNNAGSFGADSNFFRDLVNNATFIANTDGADYLGGLQNDNGTSGIFSINTVTNHTMGVSANIGNAEVRLGNLSGGNGTSITIDDTAQTINFNNNYSFPFADGTAGQVLGTDGSGQLEWQSVSGGGGQIA